MRLAIRDPREALPRASSERRPAATHACIARFRFSGFRVRTTEHAADPSSQSEEARRLGNERHFALNTYSAQANEYSIPESLGLLRLGTAQ